MSFFTTKIESVPALSPHMPAPAIPDFSTVTESPLTRASDDQLRILGTRYDLAAKHAVGKDVLEIACGAGVGLGLLARVARRLVAGDIDERNCEIARQTYRGRADIAVERIDAQNMPFHDGSFNVVILFEALYYLPSIDSFLSEARRTLRPGGTLLISSVNRRWGGFNPSPFSRKYLDAAELAENLARHGFHSEIFGSFADTDGGLVRAIIRLIRKIAICLHIIPETMKGKEWLKRLFYGELKPIPAELTSNAVKPAKLDPLAPPYEADRYRFIYAVATLP